MMLSNKQIFFVVLAINLIFLFSISSRSAPSCPEVPSGPPTEKKQIRDDVEWEGNKKRNNAKSEARADIIAEVLDAQKTKKLQRIREKACLWREQRKKALDGKIKPYNCLEWSDSRCFWDLYQPTAECDRQRVGSVSDGGKWVCDFEELVSQPDGCVIFSFGVQDNVEFEVEFQKRGCRTYSYDPSGVKSLIEKNLKKGMHFEEVGLGPVSGYPGPNPKFELNGWKIKSFKDIVASTGEKKVDVVKIDIESSEYSAVAYMLHDPDFLKLGVKQIMIEFHLTVPMNIVFEFFRIIEEAGWQIVNKESNNPCGHLCFEYVFLYVGKIDCD